MSKQNVKEEKKKGRGERRGANNIILQVILCLVCIGIGAVLLFYPVIGIKELCMIFCGGLILAAVIEILRFFITHAYDRLHDTSFSTGILLLILGVCGFLRINSLVNYFELAIGFAALAIGIVILQGMVQLNVVDNLLWILLMIFTTLTLVGAVLLILDIQAVTALIPSFAYWLLFVSGIAGLISVLFVALGIFLYRRKRRKAAEAEGAGADDGIEETPLYKEEAKEEVHEPVPVAESAGVSPYLNDTSAPTGETQVYPPISGGSAVSEAPKPAAPAAAPTAEAPKPAAEDSTPVVEVPKPAGEAPKPAAPALEPAPAELPSVPLYEEEKPAPAVSQDTESLFPDDVRSDAEKAVKTVIELPEIIPPEDLL